MTKAELIDRVMEKVDNLTKKQVEFIVNIVFNSIKKSLANGQKMEIRGFGSFRIRKRKSRSGRNPKSGDIVDVPSKNVPFFKVGKEMRELVDQ